MAFVFGINTLKKVYQDRSQPKIWYVQDNTGEWIDKNHAYRLSNQGFIVNTPFTPEGIQYGEYDEDTVVFAGEILKNVVFNETFTARPVVALSMSLESENGETSNINYFVSNLTSTGMDVNTSSPFTGTLVYRAINATAYPSYVRRNVLSSSFVYYAAAGYVNVGTTTEILLSYDSLGTTPNALFWSTVDVSGSGTANVSIVSSGSISDASAAVSMSAPLTNELHYLAVVQQ